MVKRTPLYFFTLENGPWTQFVCLAFFLRRFLIGYQILPIEDFAFEDFQNKSKI